MDCENLRSAYSRMPNTVMAFKLKTFGVLEMILIKVEIPNYSGTFAYYK